jgi:hypothetical protein
MDSASDTGQAIWSVAPPSNFDRTCASNSRRSVVRRYRTTEVGHCFCTLAEPVLDRVARDNAYSNRLRHAKTTMNDCRQRVRHDDGQGKGRWLSNRRQQNPWRSPCGSRPATLTGRAGIGEFDASAKPALGSRCRSRSGSLPQLLARQNRRRRSPRREVMPRDRP